MFWKRKPEPPKPAARQGGDPELETLRATLAKRQEEVAALELELFDLTRFAEALETRLGPLQRRLEELQTQLEEARRHAARRARWGDRADSPDLPEMKDEFEEYKKAKPRPETPPPPPPAPEPAEEADEAEIKSLFRALAKRFHPDLTTDPDEKPWREQRMAQVNEAYAARDLGALQTLAKQPDRPPAPVPKTRDEISAEMHAEIERLDGVIAALERQLDQLASSPMVQLKLDVSLARRAGHDLLAEMEADLKAEIAQVEAELAAIASRS